jgi:valyl-tRNA synthetase
MWTVALEARTNCPHCTTGRLEQDPDTLDTWFSSSLWTFTTLGWPEQTRDLKAFHPTSVMETGYDILFFWVARMVLMTSYVLKQVPFKTVYLHGLVRDKQGKKMSKSLGNGIDPLEMIAKYGADALRLSMIIGTTPGNDFRLYEEKIAGYRNFVNKLWNICRYILLSVERVQLTEVPPEPKTLADRWILSRFRSIAELVTQKIQTYQFSEAGEALYEFTWHELADWYLEVAKLEGGKDELLSYLLTQILKLWHPYTPFVTEVLWKEAFGEQAGFLMVAKWPERLPQADTGAEKNFDTIRDVVTALRNYRTAHKLPPGQQLSVAIAERGALPQGAEKIIEGLRTKAVFVPQVASSLEKLEVSGVVLSLDGTTTT